MKTCLLSRLLHFFLFFWTFSGLNHSLGAQSPISVRLGVFNIVIQKQEPYFVSITCQVANTGQMAVALRGGKTSHPETIQVEFDSAAMPISLKGREGVIAEVLKKQHLKLKPGKVKNKVKLDINISPTEGLAPHMPNACADLVIDTAFLSEYNNTTIQVRFRIKNKGQKTVSVLGKPHKSRDNLALNVYFVSGVQLTRGAILAGGLHIKQGKETLDGILLPGQSLEGTLDVDLRNRTRFSPNLALELSPGSQVEDCNRGNNVRILVVEF
jgi:hypothetical protein